MTPVNGGTIVRRAGTGAARLQAAAFYERNGFVRLPDSTRLVLPMRTIARMVT